MPANDDAGRYSCEIEDDEGRTMPHWRLHYHIVWATRGREALLDEHAARAVERSIRATCRALNAIVHAVWAMPDHVHLAVSVPPSVALAAVAKRLKGSSSHLLNHAIAASDADRVSFTWQAEYGVYSFGGRDLAAVIAYVTEQPACHAERRLWSSLEQAESEPPSRSLASRD